MSSSQAPPAPQSFSSFKLFKACQFCRRRKMKCVVKPGHTVCEKCKRHGQECVFDCKKMTSKAFSFPTTSVPSTTRVSKPAKKITPTFAAPIILPSTTFMVTTPSGFNKSPVVTNVLPSPPSPDTVGNPFWKPLSPEDSELSQDENSRQVLNMIPSLFRQWNLVNVPPHMTTPVSESSASSAGSISSSEGLIELYNTKVEWETPFINPELLQPQHLDSLCEWCLRAATSDNPQQTVDYSPVSLESLVADEQWTPAAFSCFFLLTLHAHISDDIFQSVYAEFNKWVSSHPQDVSVNPDTHMFVAAMIADAWHAVTRRTALQTNYLGLQMFEKLFENMDTSSFSYQVLYLGFMMYRYLSLFAEEHEEAGGADKKSFWMSRRRRILSYEYDMLLFPVKLSAELSVIEDELQPTDKALVIHIFHNTLLIAYYGTAVLKKGEYAKSAALYSIPGLYLFIAGMAKSNFITAPRIVDRWNIMAQCELMTAKYLLALNKEMPFDSFKEALHCFLQMRNSPLFQTQDAQSVFREIDDLLLGNEDFPVPVRDGAALYWVFRDTRSMTLDLCLSDVR